jgi:WD40 repeat protein
LVKRTLVPLISCLSGKHAATIASIFILALMVLSSFLPVLVNTTAVYAASPFTKLADPIGGLPLNDSRGVAFSHDSTYLAVSNEMTPFITIYKRSGDTFTKLANPAILPIEQARGVAYCIIYKRSGDTFTKLTDLVSSLANDHGKGVAFSPDSTYLAVSHEYTPFVTVYKRSGDTFTQLANPVGGLPAGLGRGVAFSPDSYYMAVAHANSPYITLYKRSGDTFTKLANPSNLPTGQGRAVAVSPDSTYVSVIYDAAPYIAIYKRSGDTFTTLPDPALPRVYEAGGVSFSPDGKYLAVAHYAAPRMTIFSRSGDTFTKVEDPAILPTSQGRAIAFSPNSPHLALTSNDTPFIRIYKYGLTAPGITSVNPNRGTQGQTLNVTITGNIFFGVMTCNFGQGITVNNITVNNLTQITVNISIANNAITNIRDVSVTTPANTFTLADAFRVVEQSIGTNAPTALGSSTAGPAISGPPVTLSNLVVRSASLSSTSVSPNTPVTVTADIANNSTVNGNKKVTVYVNGEIDSTQGVTLNSGSSSQLTFNVSRSEPGTYKVYVDGAPAS